MNRSVVYVSVAAALLVVAIIVGMPKREAVSVAPPAPMPMPPTIMPPAQPTSRPGSLTMTGKLSHPYLVTGTSDVFATLEVSAVEVPGSRRAPVNLAVVIDRSGSMSGAKIENAKRAASRLVDLLDEHDRLAIVHYGNDVRAFSGAFCTEENRARMKRYIANIQDEGGTNIGDGLYAGQAQLEASNGGFRVNRLLLLSDGQPTVGVTTAQGLLRIVSRIRERGISVTSLGVGADFNEDLMQRLADTGGGAYGFISNAEAMASIFEKDLKQAGTMVARSATIRLELPSGVRFSEVYGRPFTQEGRSVTVSLPDFSAGQTEKLVVHLSATPDVAVASAFDVGRFTLEYRDVLSGQDADANVKLAALVTNDATLAANKRDKVAFVDAARAQTAVNYERAAHAMDRGDFTTARKAITANEALLDEAEVVGGRGTVQADKDTNAALFGLSTSSMNAPPEMQRENVKQMKVQSLRSAGRSADSLY